MSFKRIEWTDDEIEEFWRYWRTRPDDYFSERFGDAITTFSQKRLGYLGEVLDFGAGTGGLLASCSRHEINCHGLEFDKTGIDRLRQRFSADRFVAGILTSADIASFKDYFDTVFLIETIEHLPDRHLAPTMRAILSVLKPGGKLVVSTPNDEDVEAGLVYCPVSKILFHPMQHLRSWNRSSLAAYLVSAGFEVTDTNEMDFQALPGNPRSYRIKRLIKRLVNKRLKDPHLVSFAQKPK